MPSCLGLVGVTEFVWCEVQLDPAGSPGGDASAEKVCVLGPNRTVQQQRTGQGGPVVRIAVTNACKRRPLQRLVQLHVGYVMRWRLALAARALRSRSDAISRVAERSGYETEAAFSRAFKREFGLPPSAWRKALA